MDPRGSGRIRPDGSARVHGRSDGVLNVNGIGIGPSEMYISLHRVPEIADAMAVEQRDPDHPGQSRMVLLVVLRPGAVLDGELNSSNNPPNAAAGGIRSARAVGPSGRSRAACHP